ncbi:TPA: hypothetical protein ACT2IF_001951 [Streptococcus suis]
MRVSEKGDRITYRYSGPVEEEARKCALELVKLEQELPILEAIFVKANKEFNRAKKRRLNLIGFLNLVEEKHGIKVR